MRHFVRNSIIAIALLVIAFWSSYPTSEKIGLGKDLKGGASLTYAVQLNASESANEVIPKVIEVLKRRIDPNGLFEISIVRQGQDRIEITMPLPGEHVVVLKEAFENELYKLSGTAIGEDEFDRVMRMDADERAVELERLSGGSETILSELREAADAKDAADGVRTQLELAERSGVGDETLDELAVLAADSEIRYDLLRDQILANAVSPALVRRALEESTEPKTIRNDQATSEADKFVTFASPRERALQRIRDRHPELEEQLDRVVEAYNAYDAKRDSLDDTSDLKRLVQAAGVLSFRITCDPAGGPDSDAAYVHPQEAELRAKLQSKGPRQASARDARWFKINKIDSWYDTVAGYEQLEADPAGYFRGRGYVVEEFEGDYYMLGWDARGMRMTQDDGHWGIAGSRQTTDQLGKPAIGFEMDPIGARLLGDLTGPNVGAQMAVLLDDEIYTAPNLNSRISQQGIIQGDFTIPEIEYVVRVLTAGSLQAKLSPEPISENTIAPELGQDNLDAGINAGIWALVAVSIFMVLYYFGYGLVAVTCLAVNALLIVGALALSRASLTLPGIAGIILTFGMAVDANVLIYERIREELEKGLDLRQAVRLGKDKALSSIVDGNVTNLIVCFVLAKVGTQEIRGFAITLGIGVVCTMVSALFFNNIIMHILVDRIRIKKMSMLPMLIKPLGKALHPNINWIGFRWFAVVISTVLVGFGLLMVYTQGAEMLDTEFRGGTQVTLVFKDDANGNPMTLSRSEVEERVHGLGETVDEINPLHPLRVAEIVPVNPLDDNVTSDVFNIKTYATARKEVGDAITAEFAELLDAPPALVFGDSEISDASAAPTYPVISGRLGENINRPELRNNVSQFVDGVAIVLENISPQPTLESMKDRLGLVRRKTDFIDVLGRPSDIIVIEGSADAVQSAVLLVRDPNLGYSDNANAWRDSVAQREWELVRAALAESSDQLSVQNFSPAIAENFRATAFAAVMLSLMLILIYIWVRFGSVRYSMAAIVALTHDVLAVIGLIALAEIVYDMPSMAGFVSFTMLEPFKIDLNLVAALLTIIGYSLNDTIIIMDRIRENRGKLNYASKAVINGAINETVSRTVITSGTTMLAITILYVDGGPGVHAFSYALLCGVLVGTYSSVAVAAPMVWSRKKDLEHRREEAAALEQTTEA